MDVDEHHRLHEPSYTDFPFVEMQESNIKAEAMKAGKPAMILVTTNTCPTCKGLYKSMATSSTMKDTMSKFVSVHLGEGHDWKSATAIPQAYVPRVYFLSAGGHPLELYAVRQDHPKYGYSFTTTEDLERAMNKVLAQNATAGAEAESAMSQLLQVGTGVAECKDGNEHCPSFAWMGECTFNNRYMMPNCAKACGVCSAV